MPQWFSTSLLVAIVLGAAQAAIAQAPKLRDVLPAPTGKAAIGRTTFYWTDSSRGEGGTDDPDDHRQVRVDVWYPAEPDAAAPAAVYCADFEKIKSLLGYGAVGIGNIATHARADVAVARSETKYPLLLFSPGFGNNGSFYAALVEELASHGYVVVTLDHPFQSAAIVYPDGRVVGVKAPSQEGGGDAQRALREYKDRVDARTADMRFVLDQMRRLDRGEGDTRFAGRLNLEQVGALGHSLGGVAAPAACMLDERFKAALNMDGHANSLPALPDERGAGPRQPFLELTDAQVPKRPTDEQLAKWKVTRADFDRQVATAVRKSNDLMRTIAGGSYRVSVSGATHQSFSDTVLWVAADPKLHYRRMQIIRDYVRAFFDKTLRGDTQTMLDAASSPYSEVTVERFSSSTSH